MLSVKSLEAGGIGGVAAYYENLAAEDYYKDGGEPPGQFLGAYAKELGLSGQQVEKGDLTRMLTGHHPTTGEAMSSQAAKGKEHKPGWDLTFSAPKSVSTVWATVSQEDREAISQAQAKAVAAAVVYLEEKAFTTKHGHAGADRQHYAGGLVAAAFEHSSSRNGDPQLHTHVLAANLCDEGRRIDLDTRWKMAAGAVYRVALANELQRQGYQVERDDRSFRIVGVPDALEEKWSSRRSEIEAALKAAGQSSAKAAAVAALGTRETKQDVDRAKSFGDWAAVAQELNFDPASLKNLGPQAEPPKMIEHARVGELLTEQASTVSAMQLEAKIYQEAQGAMNLAEARDYAESIKQSPTLVKMAPCDPVAGKALEVRWSTPEMIQLEKNMAGTAAGMSQRHDHQVKTQDIERAIEVRTLSAEQISALTYLTQTSGAAAVIEGVAGGGKSYMMDAARDVWEASGYTVRGTALAGKAAEGLEKASGIKSETIHKTLFDIQKGELKLDSKTVLVVDESGMVGSRQMAQLVKKADEAGAKLVLVGETKQLQPIDAGGAMRAIKDCVQPFVMTEIRRQGNEGERAMVKNLQSGNVEAALTYLESKDRLHVHDSSNSAHQAAAWGVVNDLQDGKSAIVLAETRAAVGEINATARAAMRSYDALKGEDKTFKTDKGERQFAGGDRVVFLKNDRDIGVKNGTTGAVIDAKEDRLTIRLDGDPKADLSTWKTVEVAADTYNKVDHGYAMTVHKAQGVTVDRAHYVAGELTHRELGYVAGSRHRETLNMHMTNAQANDVKETMGRSQAKDTTINYDQISKVPDELRNEKPDYRAGNRESAAEFQRAAAAAVHQPDTRAPANDAAPKELASLRELSSVPLVTDQRSPEMLLHKDAPGQLAKDLSADSEMRRTRNSHSPDAGRAEQVTKQPNRDRLQPVKNKPERDQKMNADKDNQGPKFDAKADAISDQLKIARVDLDGLQQMVNDDKKEARAAANFELDTVQTRDSSHSSIKDHDRADADLNLAADFRDVQRADYLEAAEKKFDSVKSDIAGIKGFEDVKNVKFSEVEFEKLVTRVDSKINEIDAHNKLAVSREGKEAAREVVALRESKGSENSESKKMNPYQRLAEKQPGGPRLSDRDFKKALSKVDLAVRNSPDKSAQMDKQKAPDLHKTKNYGMEM